MKVLLGYKASAEQFPADELLSFGIRAEEIGLDSVAVSDHFQPWRHKTGRAPNSLVWLGALAAKTQRVQIGTSVLTPTLRYHPAIVAQAFGTLAGLAPGRVFLGVGTGEAMNETPATGLAWPAFRERFERLIEAIELKRLLWEEDRVSFTGNYYTTDRATVYERPDHPIPIYVAAAGTRTARMAGEIGDGLIMTSGKNRELYEEVIGSFEEGAQDAGRDPNTLPRLIEVKVSYDHDLDFAEKATHWWAALALKPEEKSGIEDPVEMERLADENVDRAHTRWIVSSDPDEVVQRIEPYVEYGFTHLVFHAPCAEQGRFLDQFGADVLPRLRDRWPAAVPSATA